MTNEEMRQQMMERWSLITSLGGEWNQGYADGLRFAMSIVHQALREAEKNDVHQPREEFNLKEYRLNKSKNKEIGKW